MYEIKEMKYIKALTAVHAGTGDGLETVDMPLQREKHSNIPKIEASSLKGSIKHKFYREAMMDVESKDNKEKKHDIEEEKQEIYTLLGPEGDEDSYASRIALTDAKLLFFPIKSATNIFKLITCPYVLKRWCEDLEFSDQVHENFQEMRNEIEGINLSEGECISFEAAENEKIVLEEYVFQVSNKSKETEVGKKGKDLKSLLSQRIPELDTSRVVILNDSDFTDLVTMYTEIITRNKIDIITGAAQSGGLFTEEYLPMESILYFITLASPCFGKNEKKEELVKSAKDILDDFNTRLQNGFQVGGNATIGKGFMKILNNNENSTKGQDDK